MKEVSSLEDDAALWRYPYLIGALSEYISVTKTGFPPDLIFDLPPYPSLLPPPTLAERQTLPPVG